MSIAQNDLLECGHITGVHGIRGWLKVFSNTLPREQITSFTPWLLQINDKLIEFKVKGKKQGKLIIAHIAGCNDRNAALEFVRAKIFILKSQLPSLKAGDYYWDELRGLKVATAEGELLGTVDHLFETAAHDVIVLTGDKQRLIPFVMDDIVLNINLDKGIIRVNWQADYLID